MQCGSEKASGCVRTGVAMGGSECEEVDFDNNGDGCSPNAWRKLSTLRQGSERKAGSSELLELDMTSETKGLPEEEGSGLEYVRRGTLFPEGPTRVTFLDRDEAISGASENNEVQRYSR